MEKVCPEKGKTIAGGSIVVTASGKLSHMSDGEELTESGRIDSQCRPNRLLR